MSGHESENGGASIPTKLAHFVVRSKRYEEAVRWYETVLGARPVFANPFSNRAMKRMLLVGFLMGSSLAAPEGARGEDSCQLGQKQYPSNAVVCSNGLVVYCANGVWQSDGGQRCDSTDGSYLTPLRPYQEKSNEPIPDFYKQKYPWLHLQ